MRPCRRGRKPGTIVVPIVLPYGMRFAVTPFAVPLSSRRERWCLHIDRPATVSATTRSALRWRARIPEQLNLDEREQIDHVPQQS
jgi:hypothetical protein